jgi:hypothetical protein
MNRKATRSLAVPLALAVVLFACGGERAADMGDAGAADRSEFPDQSDLSDRSDGAAPDVALADAGALPDHTVYEDYPYKQEFHRNYTAENGELPSNDVRALAVDGDGVVWAGGAAGILAFVDGRWTAGGLSGVVSKLVFDDSKVFWAATDSGVSCLVDGAWIEVVALTGITALASRADGGVWIGEPRGAGMFDDGTYSLVINQELRVNDIAEPVFSSGDLLFLASSEGIQKYDLATGFDGTLTTADGLPSDDVRSLKIYGLGIGWQVAAAERPLDGYYTVGIAGTPKGAVVLDFMEPELVANTPFDDVTNAIFVQSESAFFDVFLATTRGAVRSTPPFDLPTRYYHSKYWLPDDDVRDGVMTQADDIFFATAGGIGHVWSESKTLADKAAHYDALNHERHVRLGYTTGNHLPVAGDTSTWTNGDDDNDGQWTGMYLGSQSLRYAVTHDPLAREYAQTAMEAMLKLESVTGAPGFFARSIVPGDQCDAKQGSGGQWHLSQDGVWCWKGDTSSDEFVGHMFGLSLYYDLVADEIEKERIAATVGRILTRIVDNGYQLVDIDGLVTEHGQFDPYFMETIGIFGDAGLNSAMILGGLRAAYHMTGDQKYMDAFRELIVKHKYHEYIKRAQEISQTAQINHDSDEMMFLAFFTLLRYEDNPKYRAWWLEGLEQTWQTQRPERNPEFNMIYAALTGSDGDLDNSIDTLKRIHWDLVVWGCNNSHRKDITIDKRKDRHGRIQSTEVVPYDERYVMKWNENPYNLDFDATGNSEESATYWLLPYWMGRFYGYITGPKE